MRLWRKLETAAEYFGLIFMAAIIIVAGIAFVRSCGGSAYGAEGLGRFKAPQDIVLSGKILNGPMDTQTSYLKYMWLEAYANKTPTAFIVIVDVEAKRPVIGFVHYAGPPDEYGNFDTWAVYYNWKDDGSIIELGTNRSAVDDYLAKYKETHETVRHFRDWSLL